MLDGFIKMVKEEIFCYHCKKIFYLDGYRMQEAKSVSCMFCGKRIDKKKSKSAVLTEVEG